MKKGDVVSKMSERLNDQVNVSVVLGENGGREEMVEKGSTEIRMGPTRVYMSETGGHILWVVDKESCELQSPYFIFCEHKQIKVHKIQCTQRFSSPSTDYSTTLVQFSVVVVLDADGVSSFLRAPLVFSTRFPSPRSRFLFCC